MRDFRLALFAQGGLAGCGKSLFWRSQFPSAAEAALILLHLRRGWKPRPFKARTKSEFFSSLLV
jgi:hypothetical protein